MADHFNDLFASIGKTFADKIPKSKYSYEKYLNNTILSSYSFQTIEQGTVKNILDQMKPKTSSGDDGISMKLLKQISEPLIPSLTILINQSLVTGIFPHEMKLAKVLPLIKKTKRV